MNLGDRGTTPDSGTEQTRELMPAAERNAVPMPLAETLSEGVDGTRSLPALSDERKEVLRANAMRKMSFVEAEYWRMRNGKQAYIRCPYCAPGRHGRRRNYEGRNMCCSLFMKAFGAILERQNQVDVAAAHVRNCHKVGLVH